MENTGTPNPQNVNQQFNQQFGQQFGQQQLPNSTAVLVLGIISLPVCFCYFLFGVPGLVMSIISFVLSNKARKAYEENPSLYTESSFKNMKAGRVCAIIGMILNSLCLVGMIVYIIVVISIMGAAFGSMPAWH
jgi:ABC-type glycerol-3-phosphate transport system permease component